MKIAITSTGTTLDSPVDPRFGRCAYFALVDPESGAIEPVANPFQEGTGGAGTQAAQWVIGQGAGAVLTGRCGPNASAVLDDADIRVIEDVSGTVGEAVDRYKRNDFPAAAPARGPFPPGPGYGPGRGRGMGGGRGRGGGGGMGPGRGRGFGGPPA